MLDPMTPNILLFSVVSCLISGGLFAQIEEEDSKRTLMRSTINLDTPERLRIEKITIEGADNFDHSAIKVISGLHEGKLITLPGEDISTAIHNLWAEQLFSDVEVSMEDRADDFIELIIRLSPRATLSRFDG
jgi:outer membrane protein assembly factor BamA